MSAFITRAVTVVSAVLAAQPTAPGTLVDVSGTIRVLAMSR